MDKKILNKIYSEHKKEIKYFSVSNPKLIICFGAVPGSGKTYISKILEEKYRAIRINNDDIRNIINKKLKTKNDKQKILEEYIFYFIKEHNSSNGLIIFDSSIDRIYKKLFIAVADTEFNIFIINIKVPKKVIINRIFNRNRKNSKKFISEIERYYNDHKKFEKDVIIDVNINNDKELNLNELFLKLESKLNKLKRD